MGAINTFYSVRFYWGLPISGFLYIPRILEMHQDAGSGGWKHVLGRKGLKDRL